VNEKGNEAETDRKIFSSFMIHHGNEEDVAFIREIT
jgi:hypothetical protein